MKRRYGLKLLLGNDLLYVFLDSLCGLSRDYKFILKQIIEKSKLIRYTIALKGLD